MTFSNWLLPDRSDNKRATRHIFYLRSIDEINQYKKNMLSSGVKPVQFLPQLGIVIAEQESSLSSLSIRPHPDVEYVESDIPVTLNEPIVGSIQSLKNQGLPWGVEYTGASKVWSKTKGKGATVVVIDTGIVENHPVIKENYIGGMNVLSRSNPPQDYNGHGTHVAGTIAGRASDIGLLGVAPEANIFALKAFNRKGSANLSDLLAALNKCIKVRDEGISNGKVNIKSKQPLVINMSFGMDKLSDSLRLAIQIAHRKGIVMVAATGNKGYSSKVDYPARYPETIGVTSISKNGKISSFSNLGKGLDIAAPGDNIPSAWLNDSRREMSGTSMAVPHVSGAVACLLSLNPNLNPEQARYIITQTATKSKHLDDDLGILNVPEAIRLLERMKK